MSPIEDLIIQQEKQLYLRKDPVSILCELVDNDFMEIGSSSNVHDKKEVIRWLKSNDPSKVEGSDFNILFLSDDVILLTYTSVTCSPHLNKPKQARRSSIWRHSAGKWRMVFHQGTPLRDPEMPL